jgi:hypothetical protein
MRYGTATSSPASADSPIATKLSGVLQPPKRRIFSRSPALPFDQLGSAVPKITALYLPSGDLRAIPIIYPSLPLLPPCSADDRLAAQVDTPLLILRIILFQFIKPGENRIIVFRVQIQQLSCYHIFSWHQIRIAALFHEEETTPAGCRNFV